MRNIYNSYKGTYIVNHPEKYLGTKNPVYKSKLESEFMRYCDNNPNILQWQYEGLSIPYHNPIKSLSNHTSGINAKYLPDFYIKYQTKSGVIEEALIEVKAKCEVIPPEPNPKKLTAAYKYRLKTFALNESKWRQAKQICETLGIKFIIITEEFIKTHARYF